MGNIAEQIKIIEEVKMAQLTSEVIGTTKNSKKKRKDVSMDSATKKTKNLIDCMLELVGALSGKISKVKKKIAEGKKRRKKRKDNKPKTRQEKNKRKDNTRKNKTKKYNTRHGEARQGKTKPDKTKQGKARQGNAMQGNRL